MALATRLVYGHAWHHDCLAFADAVTAHEEADELTAIATSPTYRDAGAIATRHISNPVIAMLEDGWDPGEALDILGCYGVADGDWPSMVTARAFDLLAEDLCQRFGRIVATVFNGDYLDIPLDHETGLVAALEQQGYTVTRDDNLINVLDGRTLQTLDDYEAIWPSGSA